MDALFIHLHSLALININLHFSVWILGPLTQHLLACYSSMNNWLGHVYQYTSRFVKWLSCYMLQSYDHCQVCINKQLQQCSLLNSFFKFHKNLLQHVTMDPSYHVVQQWTLLHLFIYTCLTMVLGPKHIAWQSFNKLIGILIYTSQSVIYWTVIS
jgi:hypothetical protein